MISLQGFEKLRRKDLILRFALFIRFESIHGKQLKTPKSIEPGSITALHRLDQNIRKRNIL